MYPYGLCKGSKVGPVLPVACGERRSTGSPLASLRPDGAGSISLRWLRTDRAFAIRGNITAAVRLDQ